MDLILKFKVKTLILVQSIIINHALGDLFLNGKKMTPNELTTKSAYVQQEDLFIGTMTVKEQLNFQVNDQYI